MTNSILDNENVAPEEISLVGFTIDRLAGEGSFSRVFRMVDSASGVDYAVKVAKERGEFFKHATGAFPTNAWSPATGRFGEARPEPSDLLMKQYRSLIGTKCSGWVTVRELREEEGRSVAIMDWFDAPTLRDLIACSSYSPELLIDIAKALGALIDSGLMPYHGDLKPDNILVVDGAPQLIDPGFFGPLLVYFDREIDMSVTTWQYYPWLKPNDMFAFGIMILEMCTGVHPFSDVIASARDSSRLGPVLNAYIQQVVSSSNNQFVENIECIPAFIDRFRDSISADLKQIALRCLGMEEEDGVFELAPVFENFADVAEALSTVEFPDEIVYHPNQHFLKSDFDHGSVENVADEPTQSSDEMKQPHIITTGIPIGMTVLTGDDCARISRKVKVGDEYQLELSPVPGDDGESDESTNLVIDGIASVDGNNYIALTLSSDFTRDDSYVTVWIAKVINRVLVMPATMDEITRISQGFMEEPDEEALEPLFGVGAFD